MHTLQVLDILPGTSVDGPGLRTSVYFAGCEHHCPGCHNPQSWDISAGRPFSIDELVRKIDDEGFNVTLSGGDPVYQLPGMIDLARELKAKHYSIWLYTGFIFEDLLRMEKAREMLRYIDIVVDGPYIEALRDTQLHFRGSSNQRLIDVPATIAGGEIVEWHPEDS